MNAERTGNDNAIHRLKQRRKDLLDQIARIQQDVRAITRSLELIGEAPPKEQVVRIPPPALYRNLKPQAAVEQF